MLKERIEYLIKEYEVEREGYVKSFPIKAKGMIKFVSAQEVYYIETFGNYIKTHLEKGYKTYRSTLQNIEHKLDPQIFMRIHRCYIVNIGYIKNVRYLNNNEYQFIISNGMQVISARSYKKKIMRFLSAR